jgi:hypothetical protein
VLLTASAVVETDVKANVIAGRAIAGATLWFVRLGLGGSAHYTRMRTDEQSLPADVRADIADSSFASVVPSFLVQTPKHLDIVPAAPYTCRRVS